MLYSVEAYNNFKTEITGWKRFN